MSRVSFFSERRTASEIMEWYASVKRALAAHESAICAAIDELRPAPAEFLGLTADEVSERFDEVRAELELATVLLLLTESEAVLRVDYLARAYEKRKDAVSRALREVHRERGPHARLDEDLLETWLTCEPASSGGIREYRGLLKLRNWLAHGRYWSPKLGRAHDAYDAEIVHEVIGRMFRALPGVTGWA